MSSHEHTNRLIDESSPYLLQHAHNPVDWHPWGEEALTKAKNENKLLIISIGYAACHWCHVMEHESFEDSIVASIMNEYFIPIKVDREERPDVDDVYMTACHLVSGRGGWPLNAFALPDGKPIWAGTYFPKEQWLNVLNQFKDLQQDDPQKLIDQADQITKGIQNVDDIALVSNPSPFDKATMTAIGEDFIAGLDFKEGGNDREPKFPMPNNFEFLMKYHAVTNDQKALEGLTLTLDKMAMGGIYDQAGGGFARYSVDKIWKAPHFEKMMYDNGQLISLYAQAYKLTKDPHYKQIIEQSLQWVEREMTNSSGGFYSSLDADSEGEEGKFYVWSKAEIDSLFPDKEMADFVNNYYNVSEDGNWEHTNILLRKESDEAFGKKYALPIEKVSALRDKANTTILKARESRVRPGLDDKILTSWNALMLKGYADAYLALGNPKYKEAALKNAKFILDNQKLGDNRLHRNYKDGKSSINGFLDDYALTIDAFIKLYQVTFDESWLDEAQGLTDYAIAHFSNPKNSMFNYTSDIDPPLVARKAELTDNVIPGSNSVMARNLKALGELLYKKEYLALSEQMLQNMIGTISQQDSPGFYSNWCQLYLDMVYPPFEIAIVGNDFENLNQEIQTHFSPTSLYLGGKDEGSLRLLQNKLQDGTMIYVCQNKACKFPVDNVAEALDLMEY
jgi:uncharacterized protein YyaL (SSP411 family)